ncbi:MAG TPA: hypothetical protein VGE74_20700 [Gemmata sp.]
MYRLFPLLALVAAPAALVPPGAAPTRPGARPALIAAPVPRAAGRPAFGANGLLTRADLEKVPFRSQPTRPDDPKQEVQRAGYDLAVHMPWATFREGEPVPAYFILRNNNKEELPLRCRFELFGPEARRPAFVNGCRYTVRNRATGEPVEPERHALIACGGGAMMTVPAGGFYVATGDIGCSGGKPLPPGEYEVDWEIAGWVRAAPVPFEVVGAARAAPVPPVRPEVHFYGLSVERPLRVPPTSEPFTGYECELYGEHTGRMSAALAVGQHGTYVPDVHTIPATDALVEARLEWLPHREGDRARITIRAVPPHSQVRFSNLPQLYFQIEAPRAEGNRPWHRHTVEAVIGNGGDLVTPLEIELRMPRDWRERAVVVGTGRVAVLVLGKPVEMPVGLGTQRVQKIQEAVRHRGAGPYWTGIVRTGSVPVRFPSASARSY